MKIIKELRAKATPERARVSQSFFKTGPGEYGEGDRFLGVAMPETRAIVRAHKADWSLGAAQELLQSEWHEVRMAGAIMLVELFKTQPKEVTEVYVSVLGQVINNWDLVDVSAPYIFAEAPEALLKKLFTSSNLWERRAAIVGSWGRIKRGEPALIFEFARGMCDDPRDLTHKATGWMLREVGKRCGDEVLLEFLGEMGGRLPRTTVRYAMEILKKKK
jgi:3-methyladenine DNA glycosylase AlkD